MSDGRHLERIQRRKKGGIEQDVKSKKKEG
jgi:hypothetical protein